MSLLERVLVAVAILWTPAVVAGLWMLGVALWSRLRPRDVDAEWEEYVEALRRTTEEAS